MTKNENDKVQIFLSHLRIERHLSENSVNAYKNDIDTFERYLNDNNGKNLLEATKYDVRGFMSHMVNNRNNAISTIERRITGLEQFYKFMVLENYIEYNPLRDIEKPKRPKTLPKFLSEDEIERLLDNAIDYRNRALLEVMYSTGARLQEVVNMNLDDIDIDKRQIIIIQGKGSKDRVVYLSKRAKYHLTKWLEERIDKIKHIEQRKSIPEDTRDAVFISSRGNRIAPRTVQSIVKKIAKTAGIKHVTPHVLRHSMASHLTMHDANIRVVQKILGHVSLETTQIYANVSDNYAKNEFDSKIPFND